MEKSIGRRVLAGLVGGALIAAALAGCSANAGGTGSNGQKSIFVFGYFPRNYNNVTQGWSKGFDEATKSIGQKYKVTLKYEGTLDIDPAAYVSFIKTAMVQQPAGIVVIPNNSTAIASGMSQLKKQYPNTKMVIMDQEVVGLDPSSFVGTDNFNAGKQAASWLVDQYKGGKLPSSKVAVFRNPPGSSSTDARLAGFLKGIEGTGLTVVKTVQPADQKASTSEAAMNDLLVANPDLGGVFSVSDVFGLGAAAALTKAGSHAQQVSIDASQEGVQAIIDSKGMSAEVAQHLEKMGDTALTTLADSLAGKSVPSKIDTGTTLVTKDNAAEFLKNGQ